MEEMPLSIWSVEEMGYVPIKDNVGCLKKLYTGELKKHWDFVTTRVKTNSRIQEIRKNLLLYQHHLRKQQLRDCSLSLTSAGLDDHTLNEKDMLLKDLTNVNHAIKKCTEKAKKMEVIIEDLEIECRNLEEELTDYKAYNKLALTKAVHLDRLMNHYGVGNNSKLKKMHRHHQDLNTNITAMSVLCTSIDSDVGDSIVNVFDNVRYFLLNTLVQHQKIEHIGLDNEINKCLPTSFSHNPSLYYGILLKKLRDMSLSISDELKAVQEKSHIEIRSTDIFNDWRKICVARRSEINSLKDEIVSEEESAREKSKYTKRILVDTCVGSAAGLHTLVCKWLTSREKKARQEAALKEFHNTINEMQLQLESGFQVASGIEIMESKKTIMRDKQTCIDILFDRNNKLVDRISWFQDQIFFLAMQDCFTFAKNVKNHLLDRFHEVYNRSTITVASLCDVSVDLRWNEFGCTVGGNLSWKLQDIAQCKVDLFDMKNFVLTTSNNKMLDDSTFASELQQLLEKAKVDYTSNLLNDLDAILLIVKNLRTRLFI